MTRSTVSFVSLLMVRYTLAGSSLMPPFAVSSFCANVSIGVFAATAPRMNSRNWNSAGALTLFREFCNRSPHLSDQ